jgi:hypothetical protein
MGSPIVGMVPVLAAIEALMVALEAASKRLDDRSRVLIKDVLYVFCTAFDHLVFLRRVPRRSAHTPHRNAVRCVVAASSQASGSRSDACYSTAIVSSPPQAACTQLSGL